MRAIRNIRAEKRVEAGRWVEAYVVGAEALDAALDELTSCPEIVRESVIAPVDLTVWRRYLPAA